MHANCSPDLVMMLTYAACGVAEPNLPKPSLCVAAMIAVPNLTAVARCIVVNTARHAALTELIRHRANRPG